MIKLVMMMSMIKLVMMMTMIELVMMMTKDYVDDDIVVVYVNETDE